MKSTYSLKFLISAVLVSLGLPLSGMNPSGNTNIGTNLQDLSGLPAFFLNAGGALPLPFIQVPVLQQQPIIIAPLDSSRRLNFIAQAAAQAPAQQLLQHAAPAVDNQSNQADQENTPPLTDSEINKKRRKEKKPEKESNSSEARSETSSSKRQRRSLTPGGIVIVPAGVNQYGTNAQWHISYTGTTSLSSSSSSSSASVHTGILIAPHLHNQNAQVPAEHPLVLSLASITSANLENLRNTYGDITNFVITNNPGSRQQFNQDLIKLLARYFPNITHLDISHVRVSSAALSTIARSFNQLTFLNVEHATSAEHSDIALSGLNGTPAAQNLRSLNLAYRRFGIGHLAREINLPALRELDLTGHNSLSAESLNTLSGASFAPYIETLRLGHPTNSLVMTLDERLAFIRALAGPNRFPALRVLDLTDRNLPEQAVNELINASFIPNLEYLNINTTTLSRAGLYFLALRAHNLRQLAFTLPTEQNPGEHVLSMLSTHRFGSRLEALALRGTITQEDMIAIINACPALRRLRISGIITENALRTLAHSYLAPQLEVLELENTGNQPFGTMLAEILVTHNFARLTHLSIPNQNIGDRGVVYLAMARLGQNLRVLNLSNNDLTALSWLYIAHPQFFLKKLAFSQLQELSLANNSQLRQPANSPIEIRGTLAFSQHQRPAIFRNTLRVLDLTNTDIQPAHIAELAQADLPSLRELSIRNPALDNELLTWLQALGQATFAGSLTTLNLTGQQFISLHDRNEILASTFEKLISLTLKKKDHVLTLD